MTTGCRAYSRSPVTVDTVNNKRYLKIYSTVAAAVAFILFLAPSQGSVQQKDVQQSTPGAITQPQKTPIALTVAESEDSLTPPDTNPCPGSSSIDMSSSTDFNSMRSCWEEQFASLAARYDIKKVLSSIKTWRTNFGDITGFCHELEHRVGRAAFDRLKSVTDALRLDDRDCQYGYRHGVFEAFASQSGPEAVLKVAGTVCETYKELTDLTPDEMNLEVGECLHSLGHAAAIAFPTDVVAAVKVCDAVVALASKTGCAGGVLMEFVNSYLLENIKEGVADEQHGPSSSKIDKETVDKLCDILPSDYLEECFRRVPPMWGVTYQKDTGAMIDRCQKEAGEFIEECLFGVGEWIFRLVGRESTPAQRIAATIEYCTPAPSGLLRGACTTGSVRPMRANDLWAGRPESEWMEVCDLLDAPSRPKCEEAEKAAEDSFNFIPRD